MSITRSIAMLTLCVGVIIVCIWTFPTTDPVQRPALIAASITAACAGAMFALQFAPKRRLVPEADGSVIIRGERARWAVGAVCAGAAALTLPTAAAPAITADMMDRIHLWVLIAILAPLSLYLFWLTWRAPDLWRLDLVGVESLTGVRWSAPWSAVAGFETVTTAQGYRYLALVFEAGRMPPAPILRGVARFTQRAPFAITADGSAHDFRDISAHATRLWRDARGVR